MTDDAVSEAPMRRTTLGAVLADIQPGFAAGKHSSNGDGLPHLRPMNVTRNGQIDRTDLRSVAPDLADKPARRLKRGDVLFNNTNSLELVGKTALFDDDDEPAFSNHMTRLRVVPDQADPRFIAKLLHYLWASGEFRQVANNHVSQASISRAVLSSLPIELPPLSKQRRIAALVGAIDERGASINDRLAAARRIIVRLRGAVFAAACSGCLTNDWRDRAGVSLAEWPVMTMAEACARVQSGTTPKQWHEGPVDGVPFLKVYNIVEQQLDFDYKPQFISRDLHEGALTRAAALPGDVLMNIVGPPLGKVAIVSDQFPEWSINQALTLFRPSKRVTTGWLYLFLCSGASVRSVLNRTRGQVGQVNISLSQCRAFEIPVPSFDEQHEIVRRSSAMLARVDRLDAVIGQAETALDRASRAARAQAFRGDLIPTEPEPIIGGVRAEPHPASRRARA